MLNLGRYKIIGAPCEVLIPFEKRRKAHKLALKTEPGRLLAVLSLKTFIVWVPIKRIVVKTPFIKLKERVLLRDKTVIPKDLSAGEGELIDLVMSRGELHASKWCRRTKGRSIKGEGRERNLASQGVTAIYINAKGSSCLTR